MFWFYSYISIRHLYQYYIDIFLPNIIIKIIYISKKKKKNICCTPDERILLWETKNLAEPKLDGGGSANSAASMGIEEPIHLTSLAEKAFVKNFKFF